MKTLKYTAVGVAVLGLIGGSTYVYMVSDKPVAYVAPEYIEVEKEIVVNPRDEKIRQREEELNEKYNNIKKLEARLDVLTEDRDSIDAEIITVRSELASFTIGE